VCPNAAQHWIDKLSLTPHPEGGWFRETYRSGLALPASALQPHFQGARAASTAIYYLLTAGVFSAFHRIRSDEVWHHYAGGNLRIHVLPPDGSLRTHVLGTGPGDGRPQLVVPAGAWFAAEPVPGVDYALVGCTVAPGFDFEDFELAEAGALSARWPRHRETIERLCRARGTPRQADVERYGSGDIP
jgi:predicted cupin superfamily sugar epimerase